MLKEDGIVIIRTTDLQSICEVVAQDKLLEPLYESPIGPISPIDMMFGNRKNIARGNEYMAQKGGFTYSVLNSSFGEAGFKVRYGGRIKDRWEISLVAFKQKKPDEEIKKIASPFF